MLLLLTPRCLGPNHSVAQSLAVEDGPSRRRFVHASMRLALFASIAVSTFRVRFKLFGSRPLRLTNPAIAAMLIACSLAMLAAQSISIFSSVRNQISRRCRAAVFAGLALALPFKSPLAHIGGLTFINAVVAIGVAMVGPVLSYELLGRQPESSGSLLGQQPAVGELEQATGYVVLGFPFALAPMMPLWSAAVILLVVAALSLPWWGPARRGEIANRRTLGSGTTGTCSRPHHRYSLAVRGDPTLQITSERPASDRTRRSLSSGQQ